jgi:VIT1/CCC1 family predicted Fe2+/Mn2+ transporter
MARPVDHRGDHRPAELRHFDHHHHHKEQHRSDRIAWLRAAVLGAGDGILSTAALMIGVAAASAPRSAILVAGLAGLVAGAMSMAVGEYTSVSSQRDTERADVARERAELHVDPDHELTELTEIYEERGLDPPLAQQVASRLMEVDPLGSHLRDELGITEENRARPLQAAGASATSFALGGLLPLVAVAAAPARVRVAVVVVASLGCLALLGAFSGQVGGASRRRAAGRVALGGAVAMVATAIIGRLVGANL